MSAQSRFALVGLGVLALAMPAAGGAAERADLIVTNAHVLTMDAERSVFEGGTVVVRGDVIVAVGGSELRDRYEAEVVIDAGGDIAMPGMINLHNHIAMVAFRGLGEDGVKDRLFEFFFPLEKEMLSRDLIRIASRHGAIEMALAGVTLVTDMYYHEDEVARGVAEVGIRGVLGETVIGFPVVDAPEPWGGLAYAEEFIKEWKGHPLITPAVAPHAPYTVPPEWLLKSKALAEREGVPILLHMAEFEHEIRLIRDGVAGFPEGKSVVGYLEDIGFLSDSLLAAHVIYVDAEDMAILKRRGVGVSHNPKANSRGATGMSPAWEMFKQGLDVGLGTDGPMGSNQMDILNVLHHAASVARLRGKDGTRFTPRELVEMATMGGARALDMEDQIGSLEVGKKADIVIVDIHAPNMQPVYDPYATLVFAAYPENVRATIVAGEIIAQDGVVKKVDMAAHWRELKPLTDLISEFARALDRPSEAAKPEVNLTDDGLAIEGYDPVAYFEEGSARRGSEEYSFEHGGARYRFASTEHLESFRSEPEKYLPRYGGWCAYGFGMDPEETGYPQGPYPIDPKNFKIVDGELYLFFNENGYNALEQWNRDEPRFRNRAESFWAQRDGER